MPGCNFSRPAAAPTTRANATFDDANAVVTQLQTSLLPAIQQAPHIQSVNSILVGANPLNVRIAQSGAGLRATVSDARPLSGPARAVD
jgi:hypothetical protein